MDDLILSRILLHNKLATEEQIFQVLEKQIEMAKKGQNKSVYEIFQESKTIEHHQLEAVEIAYKNYLDKSSDKKEDLLESIPDDFLTKVLILNGNYDKNMVEDYKSKKNSVVEYKDKSLATYLVDEGELDKEVVLKISELYRVRLRDKNEISKKLQKISDKKDKFFIETALQNGVISSEEVERIKKDIPENTKMAVYAVETELIDPILAKNLYDAEPEVILVTREGAKSSTEVKETSTKDVEKPQVSDSQEISLEGMEFLDELE